MITVDRDTFEVIIAKFVSSTEYETDVEYSYDTFFNDQGNMLAMITYHAHCGEKYTLHGDAEKLVRDALGIPHTASVEDKIYRIGATNG